MRVITLNANGIRSAARKGFFDWLPAQQADLVCIQETKAQQAQLLDPLFHPAGYHCHYHDALRKGYSGVAVYSRRAPQTVTEGLGWAEFDAEGRYLELGFDGLAVVSLYAPSGSSGEVRQAVKFAFMERFLPHLEVLRRRGSELVICGDINIAHTERDLKNWRGNRRNSGFLPEERAWMDRVLGEVGWVDAYRALHPQAEGEGYTWWSNRGQAWARNVGWRIDYQLVSPGLGGRLQRAEVYKAQRFSDHAPLTIDYDWQL